MTARLHAHACARCPAPPMPHSVCRTPQAAICVLSGAMEMAWVAMAQLDKQLQMGRVCMRVVCGLRRSCARIAFRQLFAVCGVAFRI